MGKMFKTITRTWNPFTGCGFNCKYCWAKSLADGKYKSAYPNGFIPEVHLKRFSAKFKDGEKIFVTSMGDISFCPKPELKLLLGIINMYPETTFLFCTKNPAIYCQFPELNNAYYGSTIETNRTYPASISKAPDVRLRYAIMTALENVKKFVSIEPIMDFDVDIFSQWIIDINPEIVEIGADNYRHNLPEPTWDKVSAMIERIKSKGIQVKQKDGLQRLNESRT